MKVFKVMASLILSAYVLVGGVITGAVMLFGGTFLTALRVGFAWPAYPWIMGWIK